MSTQPTSFPVEPTWRPLLIDLGVQPGNVLRRALLPEDLLSRPEASMTTEEYFRFWRALEAELGDPLFPIRIVESLSAELFVPLLFAALCSPNLDVALDRISTYKRLIAPMALHVTRDADSVTAAWEWLDKSVEPPPSLLFMEIAFMIRLARMATRDGGIQAVGATAPLPVPDPEIEKYCGTRIRREERLSVSFSRTDAQRPFLTANTGMWDVFEPDLRRRLAELEKTATVAERVQAVLLESLPSGTSSIEEVAGRLAMSKRTLQRKLNAEGASFQSLLSQTREKLARHYLARTELTCTEISFLLGYEEPNSFFRAFHEWTGDSPEHMRQTLRH